MNTKTGWIRILRSIRPKEKGSRLTSPEIDKRVKAYKVHENEIWNKFLAAEEGSLEEEVLSRQLSKIYLLKTSQKLASPEAYLRSVDRDKWAKRFTEASIKLYGAPQLHFVEQIIKEQATGLQYSSGTYIDEVSKFYTSLAGRFDSLAISASQELKQLDEEQIKELTAAFKARYSDWFDYIERKPRESYTPADLATLFTKLISLRAKTDSRWGGWRAELEDNKDIVSVIGFKRLISVGAQRAAADYNDALGLVSHELGIHAERAVNGSELDEALGSGYPGYLSVEESLGILAERLVTGRMPDKAQDRYVDIALAMGLIPDVRLSRVELIELATNRALARKELAGAEITEDAIDLETKKAKTHVNRIFRGGDGLSGDFQAVFTKDSIYYPAVIEDYLAKGLAGGTTATEIFDFLLQGKFDPTNSLHLERLTEAGGKVKPPLVKAN